MKISVLIPLYNKKSTILRAVQSILDQTVMPLEVIIVNDGSTDGSENLIDKLSNPLIRLIHQRNQGVSAARNRGIAESKGDWIALLDADDYWDKDYLETITWLKEKYTKADLIFTSYRYFDDFGITNPKHEFGEPDGIMERYFFHACHGSPPIWTGAVCISKRALEHVGLFPVNVTLGEDLLTWARLALSFKIAYSLSIKSNYYFQTRVKSTTRFRLPERNDHVGNELKALLSSVNDDITKRDLKKYISHWHKMRLHLFIQHKKRREINREYLKCIHFNLFNYKAHMLFIYSFFPESMKSIIMNKVTAAFK